MTRWRRGNDGERGAAAVEFAVVLPLLVTMLFGIIEVGFIFNRWMTVTHSAREGVRRMALGDPAATAAAKALAAAGGISPTPTCSGSTLSSPANTVQMVCSTSYDLQLFIYSNNVVVSSTARASQE